MNAIERAVEAVGGQQVELARRLSEDLGRKVHPQQVHRWIRARTAPSRYWFPIERVTAGAVKAMEWERELGAGEREGGA